MGNSWLDSFRELPSGLDRLTGAGVTVAIVDSGIDGAHPEFADLRGQFIDFTTDEPPRIQGLHQGVDEVGHGTLIASLIAGSDYGVARGLNLIVCRISRTEPDTQHDRNLALTNALNWLFGQRVDFINLSIGLRGYHKALERQLAEHQRFNGTGIVAALGTGGATYSPGNLEACLGVGAAGRAGFDPRAHVEVRWTGVRKPDLWAPGLGVRGAAPRGESQTRSGTSLAAAVATGLSALTLQFHRQHGRRSGHQLLQLMIERGASEVHPWCPRLPDWLQSTTAPTDGVVPGHAVEVDGGARDD